MALPQRAPIEIPSIGAPPQPSPGASAAAPDAAPAASQPPAGREADKDPMKALLESMQKDQGGAKKP
jgi:hypothetical protein